MRLRALARALVGVGAFACAGDGHGAPASDPIALLDAELAAIASDARKPLASLSVLAIREGRVVYERQLGRRHIPRDGQGGQPANASTLYRVASISKLVTTLGVMRLVEAGKLDLDADVSAYLGWRLRNPRFPDTPITLRHLLSHRSSIVDDAGYQAFGDTALREVLQPDGRHHGEGRMWSSHAPGTYFQYANLPWGVVASAMERVAGEPFDALMRRLVLAPLGMGGAYDPASLPEERRGDLATLYRKATAGDVQKWDPAGPWVAQVDDHEAPAPAPRTPAGYVPGTNALLGAPQGGLRASAADLGRAMLMLMDEGRTPSGTFLPAAALRTMLARQWTHDGGANGRRDYGGKHDVFNAWGLGNQHFLDLTGPARGDRLVADGSLRGLGHRGDAYGLQSLLALDPATRDGIVVLIGGTGFDPATDPGVWSWAPRYEERIVDAIWRRAIQRRAD